MKALTLQDYKRRLMRVLVYIHAHLDDPLELERLAGLACFSPCHFHRIFTGMTGESVKEYVRRLRLERAANRLKLSAAAVTSIALDAGYPSHEAFTRSFRVRFGLSPTQFRRSKRNNDLPEVASGLHYNEVLPIHRFKTPKTNRRAMEVKIEHIQPSRVAFMRHVGPYDTVGATWDKLLPFMGKEGLLGGDVRQSGFATTIPM
jgi:AraC family transcriptional regulator